MFQPYNPMDLISLMLMGVALIIGIFLLRVLFKQYKQNEDIGTLMIIIGGLLLYASAIALVIHLICDNYLGLAQLGDLIAIIGTIFSAGMIISFDIFAFHMTFPERVKSLTIFTVILAIIFVVDVIWAHVLGPPFRNLTEPLQLLYTYAPIIQLIMYCALLPILFLSTSVFFYYAFKIREENKPYSIHSFWMGLGLLFFDFGFIYNYNPPSYFEGVVLLGLFFYLAFAIIEYICFSKPDWFKRRIGLTV